MSKIKICPGCKCEIESKKLSTHARMCEKYKEWKKGIEEKLTYDFLYKEYIVKEKSMGQISRELGLFKTTLVENKIVEYGIKIRTPHENRMAKGYKELCQKTSMEKYGVPYHTMKESPIREKIDNGVKEKYGYDNISQVPEIKEKLSKKLKGKRNGLKSYKHKTGFDNPYQNPIVKEKIRQTNLKKYSYEYATQNDKVKEKIKRTRNKHKVSGESLLAEQFFLKLESFLDLNDELMFKPKTKEFYIRYDEKTVYRYDFVDLTKKKIIEFNGSFWHANPKKYSAGWYNSLVKKTAQQIWDRDNQKAKLAQTQGFDILTIWDEDVKKDMDLILKQCVDFINA